MTSYMDISYFESVATIKPKLSHPDSEFVFSSDDVRQKFTSGKPAVVVAQHNDMFSWVGLVPTMCEFVLEAKKTAGRPIYPFAVFHKSLDVVPLLGGLASKFTGNVIPDFSTALQILSNVEGSVVGTCPEGANCNFMYDEPVGQFSQYGLIKAALMTDANIFYLTIKQDQKLSFEIGFPMLGMLVDGATGLKLPMWRPSKIKGVCDFYQSDMTSEQFRMLSRIEQRQYVQIVGDRLRRMMNDRYASIEL